PALSPLLWLFVFRNSLSARIKEGDGRGSVLGSAAWALDREVFADALLGGARVDEDVALPPQRGGASSADDERAALDGVVVAVVDVPAEDGLGAGDAAGLDQAVGVEKAVDTPIETAIGAQRRVVHDDQHVAAAHRGVGAGGDQRGELVVADASGGDPGHDGNARGVEADDGVLLAEEANHGPGPLHLVAGQVGVEEVAEPLLEAALAHAAGCEDVVVAGDDGEAVGPIGQRSERLAHALE